MPRYRLAGAAKGDLAGIIRYGERNYGPEASNAYRDKLEAHFARLALQPYLYTAVDDLRVGYRRSVCGVHVIYYRVVDDGVEIIRILRSQDLRTSL